MKYYIELGTTSSEGVATYKPFLVPKEHFEDVLKDAKDRGFEYVVKREDNSRTLTILEGGE